MQKRVSVYKDAEKSSGKITRTIDSVMDAISSQQYASLIQEIREAGTKDERDALKKKLPSFTAAGVFDRRVESGLVEPAHLIILDVDHQDPKKCMHVAHFDEHVAYGFVSPSGEGYKFIVPICPELEIESWKDYYYNAFALLFERFKHRYDIALDPSGKNINRICFVSYDPTLVRKEAKPLSVDPTPPPLPEKKVVQGKETDDFHFKMGLAMRFVAQHKEFEEGRNNYIYELASTLNRMGVHIDDASALIDEYFDLPNFSDPSSEWAKTIKSAYFHHRSEHGTKVVTVSEESFQRPVFKEGSVEMSVYRTVCEILKGVDNINHAKGIIKYYHKGRLQFDGDYDIDKELYKRIVTMAYEDTRGGDNLQSMGDIADEMATVFTYNRPPVSISRFNLGPIPGWSPANVIGLVGTEGSFKSFYALTEAINCAENGVPVYYGNYEMSQYQLIKRLTLMLFGEDFDLILKSAVDKRQASMNVMARVKDVLGDNFLMHSKPGAKPEEISNTIDAHEQRTGNKIRFGVVDGIWGLHQWTTNNISSAMKNASELKEAVKKSLTPFLVLSHSKTGTSKHFRNQHDCVLGGRQILSNLDGFISMSKIIDPSRSDMENHEYMYRSDYVWMRYDNRRESGDVIDVIGEISEQMRILETDFNPADFESRSMGETRRRVN